MARITGEGLSAETIEYIRHPYPPEDERGQEELNLDEIGTGEFLGLEHPVLGEFRELMKDCFMVKE